METIFSSMEGKPNIETFPDKIMLMGLTGWKRKQKIYVREIADSTNFYKIKNLISPSIIQSNLKNKR